MKIKNKKNLIILEDSSYVNYSGGQVVTESLIKKLKDDYKILLVDFISDSKFVINVRRYVSEIFIHKFKLKRSNDSKLNNTKIIIYKNIFYPFYFIFNLLHLLNFIKKNKNLVCVISMTRHSHVYLYAIKFFYNIKIIAHVHSNELNSRNKLKVMNYIYKKFDHVIFVSRFIQNLYTRLNSSCIYNPVLLNNYSASVPNINKIKIGFVGKLQGWKGIEIFLLASNFFTKKNIYKDISWSVYGDGENLNKYKKNFNNVNFFGFIKKSDIYKNIDILVLPSIDAESCPMTILEAISQSKLVITTDFGGQAEIVKKYYGLLIKPNNVNELISAIKLAINNIYDPEIQKIIDKCAIQIRKDLSITSYYEKYKRVINALN